MHLSSYMIHIKGTKHIIHPQGHSFFFKKSTFILLPLFLRVQEVHMKSKLFNQIIMIKTKATKQQNMNINDAIRGWFSRQRLSLVIFFFNSFFVGVG